MSWLRLALGSDSNPLNGTNRRRRGRLLQDSVMTSLGSVLDLSAGGMRIASSQQHEGTIDLRLSTFEEQLDLQAEVRWSQRSGRREFTLGLKLLNPTPEQLRALCRIASTHRLREAL